MFSKVFKHGKYASDFYLTVYVLKNYNRNAAPKLGISVSAKNGGAVLRNRVKRIIREAFARVYARVPHGNLIVVMGRKPCFDRSVKTQTVLSSLEAALKKLKLL